MNKNICIFSQTLFAGGAEKQSCLLAKALHSEHNVFFLVYYGEKVNSKYQKMLLDEGIDITFLEGSPLSKFISACKFMKRNKINVIFSYLLAPSIIGGILGKVCGVKNTFGGIRSSKLDGKKVLLNKIAQNWLNYKTIYNNHLGFKKYAKQGFNKNKALVIPNCLEFIPESITRESSTKATILSVGRFHEAKDYLTALKSIQILHSKGFDFKYQIVGYGHLEESIRNWVTELKLDEVVEIIINPDDVHALYRKADIYLLSSIFEGLPNTILEAMSFSLPIVTTDVGDVSNLLTNNKNALIKPLSDSEQLSNGLEVLLNDFNKRIEMGKENYMLAQADFSFEQFQKRHLELIDSLK